MQNDRLRLQLVVNVVILVIDYYNKTLPNPIMHISSLSSSISQSPKTASPIDLTLLLCSVLFICSDIALPSKASLGLVLSADMNKSDVSLV